MFLFFSVARSAHTSQAERANEAKADAPAVAGIELNAEGAEKLPTDLLVDITFGRALALFRLGRSDEATAALRAALEHSPKVGKFLLAERRRKPRIDPHGVRIGGDDEAWLYREAMRETWQATPGAMAWLGEVARGRR